MNLFRRLLLISLFVHLWTFESSASNENLSIDKKFGVLEFNRHTLSFGVGYQFNIFSAHRINTFPKAYPNSFLCQFKYSLNNRSKIGVGSNYSVFSGKSNIVSELSKNWNANIPKGSLINISGNDLMFDFFFTSETSAKVSFDIIVSYLIQTTNEDVYLSHNPTAKVIKSENGISNIQSFGGSASINFQFLKNIYLFNRCGVYVPLIVKQSHNYNNNSSRGKIRVTAGVSYNIPI